MVNLDATRSFLSLTRGVVERELRDFLGSKKRLVCSAL